MVLSVNKQCMAVNQTVSKFKCLGDDPFVMIPPTLKHKLIYEEE